MVAESPIVVAGNGKMQKWGMEQGRFFDFGCFGRRSYKIKKWRAEP